MLLPADEAPAPAFVASPTVLPSPVVPNDALVTPAVVVELPLLWLKPAGLLLLPSEPFEAIEFKLTALLWLAVATLAVPKPVPVLIEFQGVPMLPVVGPL